MPQLAKTSPPKQVQVHPHRSQPKRRHPAREGEAVVVVRHGVAEAAVAHRVVAQLAVVPAEEVVAAAAALPDGVGGRDGVQAVRAWSLLQGGRGRAAAVPTRHAHERFIGRDGECSRLRHLPRWHILRDRCRCSDGM